MSGKIYGYARVSTHMQNEARQMIALREFGVPDKFRENIFTNPVDCGIFIP